MKKRVVVFTGAGVSADSGISTFRDSDGLWNNYRIEDVCTPEALERDRATVIHFYNQRRKDLSQKEPNAAHIALKRLEEYYDVRIITQNIDDLHERAGSTSILHLHGELGKLCSSKDHSLTVPIEGWEQQLEDRHPDGSYLRPFIVFFGEGVPMFEPAARICEEADLFVVIGTSLQVYPAASLIRWIKPEIPVYVVDPQVDQLKLYRKNLHLYAQRASEGVPQMVDELIQLAQKSI